MKSQTKRTPRIEKPCNDQLRLIGKLIGIKKSKKKGRKKEKLIISPQLTFVISLFSLC